MKLVNLASGGFAPPEGWIFIDLHPMQQPLPKDYIHHDLKNGIPFEDNTVDGLFCSHFLEHITLQESVVLLTECRRVLKPDGVLRISVPDSEKFHNLTYHNCEDWGEPNGGQNYNPPRSFMHWALFFEEHQQLLDANALFCLLSVANLRMPQVMPYKHSQLNGLAELDNRPIFSLFMEAKK